MTDLVLTRGRLVLRPLRVEDGPALCAAVDVESWAGMSVPLPSDDAAMCAHLTEMLATPGLMGFAVEWEGRFVGRTAYYDFVPGVRVDIGHTIYARSVWGSAVNPTAKLLLLDHAFDQLGVERVALRCDHRNERSHRASARLGARFEGTLRRYRRAADGTIADVDYFSILREEWPSVRPRLIARADAEG